MGLLSVVPGTLALVLPLPQCPPNCPLFFHISPPSSLLLFSFLLLSAPKFQRPSALDLGLPRRPELGWVGSQPHRKRASLAFPCSCPGLGSATPPPAGSATSAFQARRQGSAPQPEHRCGRCAGSLGLCTTQSSRLSVLVFPKSSVEGTRGLESGVVGSSPGLSRAVSL